MEYLNAKNTPRIITYINIAERVDNDINFNISQFKSLIQSIQGIKLYKIIMNNEVSKIFPSERVIEAFELYSTTKDHIRTLITDQYYDQVLHAKKYKNDKILSVNLPRCW